MEDKKEFKTIMLRGLEDNQKLCNIINRAMAEYDIKTGQNAIYKIIEQYSNLQSEREALKEEIRNRDKVIRELKNENYIKTQVLQNLKSVMKFLDTL